MFINECVKYQTTNYQKLSRLFSSGADGSGVGSVTGSGVGSTIGTGVGSTIGTAIGISIGENIVSDVSGIDWLVLESVHVSNPSDKPYPYAVPYTNHICVMAAANVAKITITPERATELFIEIDLGIKNDRINTKTIETINPYAIDHKNVYPTALALPIIIF